MNGAGKEKSCTDEWGLLLLLFAGKKSEERGYQLGGYGLGNSFAMEGLYNQWWEGYHSVDTSYTMEKLRLEVLFHVSDNRGGGYNIMWKVVKLESYQGKVIMDRNYFGFFVRWSMEIILTVTGKFILRKFHLGKFDLENSSYGKFRLWKKKQCSRQFWNAVEREPVKLETSILPRAKRASSETR